MSSFFTSETTCKAILLNHILQCRQGWRNNSHIFVNFLPLVSTCVHCSFTFTVCVCFVTIVNGLKNPTQCRLHYSNKLSPLFSASNMHHCRRLSNSLRARFGIYVSNSPCNHCVREYIVNTHIVRLCTCWIHWVQPKCVSPHLDNHTLILFFEFEQTRMLPFCFRFFMQCGTIIHNFTIRRSKCFFFSLRLMTKLNDIYSSRLSL